MNGTVFWGNGKKFETCICRDKDVYLLQFLHLNKKMP